MKRLLITGWIICSILCYGLFMGFIKGEFQETAEHRLFAHRVVVITYSIFGPIGLAGVLFANIVFRKSESSRLTFNNPLRHGFKF